MNIPARFLLALSLFFSMAACNTLQSNLPVILVDFAHHADPNQFYEISAGEGFVLDASQYQFLTPSSEQAIQPNTVQVMVGPHTYTQAWPANQPRLEVTIHTLTPAPNAPALAEFISGQQFFILIGNSTSSTAFTPLWMSAISIK